jgi:shikimate 5-dehydrogenase
MMVRQDSVCGSRTTGSRRQARRNSGSAIVLFLGVDTRGSSAIDAFPCWSSILGLDAAVEGVDLPLDSADADYRLFIDGVRGSTDVRGAVVTAHKANLFHAARELVDEVRDDAVRCREISVLGRDGAFLFADAIDVASIRAALAEMLRQGFPPNADVICLGAGATATALMVALLDRDSCAGVRPRRVIATDVCPSRLERLRHVVSELAPALPLELRLTAAEEPPIGDLADIAVGSLIVNATGLGKDRPGAPVRLPARWPDEAVVWDLNYRGALPFLHDAARQADRRGLRVHDGWSLFIHGWAEALAAIFARPVTENERNRMRAAAERARR